MTFNSIEFLLFSIIFFTLWPICRKNDTSRWTLITVASLIFYGWWDWRFLFLILFSGTIDYIAGLLLVKSNSRKKTILHTSLIMNLGSLAIFKYSFFFATAFQDILSLTGYEINLLNKIPKFTLILPVGISFYTFQSLSYTIDIYRNRLKPTRNILHFFSYLSMFPQLVAGPIVRANDFLSQLKSYKIPNRTQRWNAIKMITYGLFQKVVIADNLSYLIDSAYEDKTNYNGSLYWWVIAFAFAFQIYNDFSGYSLIARGLAKYMGYHFKMNFNHPYLAKSLREFWSRWHISLSTWFRDYIYIPLGGSRNGKLRAIYTLTITMVLSGLWHGANYTFLIWAILHTFFLLVERYTNWINKIDLPHAFRIFIVFIQVTLCWVYFRAANIHQANYVIERMFGFFSTDFKFLDTYCNNILYLVLGILIECGIYIKSSQRIVRKIYNKNSLDILAVSVSIIMILFFRGEGKQFIYFQF